MAVDVDEAPLGSEGGATGGINSRDDDDDDVDEAPNEASGSGSAERPMGEGDGGVGAASSRPDASPDRDDPGSPPNSPAATDAGTGGIVADAVAPGPPAVDAGVDSDLPSEPRDDRDDDYEEGGSAKDCSPPDQPPPDVGPEAWESGLESRPDAAALNLPGTLAVAAPGWTTVEAFPGISFDHPTAFEQEPGSDRIFVAERNGRLYAFPNDPNVAEKELVLDISDRTQGEEDCGLLGLAFHPEFGVADSPNRGYVYVHYAFNPDPIVGRVPPAFTPTYSRLSRFTMDSESKTFDPTSELVLIDQYDDNLWHQGGSIFFGPKDGFLYLALGDEGDGGGSLNNCQRLDRDLFSGVLRIDVDMRGGDVSHPITRQPESGTTGNYFIPNDNPFVGQPNVLEEFYALGLRNPHRMTHDTIDDVTWIGEVGQDRSEELDVLSSGANYQWNYIEGKQIRATPPATVIGTWTDPVLEISREEASSVIGGYVYRGNDLPYLYGKYVFGDFMSGGIWALSYGQGADGVRSLSRELLVTTALRGWVNGITSFGIDSRGEMYILTFGAGSKIFRLARTSGFSNAPLHLSETGVFTDTADDQLVTTGGFVPYDVKSPLWSDGAAKSRWASVPKDGFVAFSETESWSFPVGTVLVKHFDLQLDEAEPTDLRRLETRLLVHGSDGKYFGISYKWNEAGTDADLLLESQKEPIDVRLADGSVRRLQYFYPGPGDCGVCHNEAAGSVLGVRTSQLNHDIVYAETGRSANQVFTWGQVGLLDAVPNQSEVSALESLVAVNDESASPEARVRSYWASNCSMCHGSVPEIHANWNARYDVPLSQQQVVLAPSRSSTEPGAVLVAPQELERSVLYARSASSVPGYAMPPMGRSVADPDYVRALEQWIQSLPAAQPSASPETL